MVKPAANRIDAENVNQFAFIILDVIDKFLRGFDQLFRKGHVFVSLLVFGWLYRLNSRRLDPVREWLADCCRLRGVFNFRNFAEHPAVQALDVVAAGPDHIELDEVSADDPFAAKVFAVDNHQIIRGYV
jgi:hypothetical protein